MARLTHADGQRARLFIGADRRWPTDLSKRHDRSEADEFGFPTIIDASQQITAEPEPKDSGAVFFPPDKQGGEKQNAWKIVAHCLFGFDVLRGNGLISFGRSTIFADSKEMTMPKARDYRAIERLRDGRPIEIRALRPNDEADMLAAIGRTSPEALRRRFFVAKRGFSQKEIDFFMKIDFSDHVALVALADEDGRPTIVGGGRYIVVEPGRAEVAFIVIDGYQRQGRGRI